MAGSRLTNFGTIFSRMTGLLESGAVKEAPTWYSVYKQFPPEIEPKSDRQIPRQDPIPEIIYEEDFDRVDQGPKNSRRYTKKRPNFNTSVIN